VSFQSDGGLNAFGVGVGTVFVLSLFGAGDFLERLVALGSDAEEVDCVFRRIRLPATSGVTTEAGLGDGDGDAEGDAGVTVGRGGRGSPFLAERRLEVVPETVNAGTPTLVAIVAPRVDTGMVKNAVAAGTVNRL
jgi:hypothetical protein